MTTFYLVRHGDVIKKPGDIALSALGKNEAEKTGMFFKDKKINLILSSPQKRAKQTAIIIKKILKSPFLGINDLLKERINFGDDPNQGYRQFIEMAEKSSLNRNYVLPNGETSINTGKRLKSVLELFSTREFKNVVIVTHGGIITDYLRNVFTEKDLNLKISNFHLKRETAIATCSVTIVRIENDRQKLLEIGTTSHLAQQVLS